MSIELVVRYDGVEQTLQVDEAGIICFDQGIVGFQEWRRFVLLEDPEEAPIGVLQCLDDPLASFLVIDPCHIVPDYSPAVPAEDLRALELASLAEAQLLCTLAAREGNVRVTANLMGPIVINSRTRKARQVVLQDPRYPAQYPVLTIQEVGTRAEENGEAR